VVNDANTARAAAEKQASDSQSDIAACTDKLGKQSDAVTAWKKAATDAEARYETEKKKGATKDAALAQQQAAYVAIVNAPPVKDLTCQQELARVDKLLRDAAKTRAGATGAAK
jgi:hypothetical protein